MTTIAPRLPLYPKPLRKEPKPQKARSMTIAAGFRCFDGVLLATDSQHSAGLSKYSGPKIWKIECGDFFPGQQPNSSLLLIAGTGMDSSILEVVHALKEDGGIQGNCIDFGTIENAIRRCTIGKEATFLIAVKVYTENHARLLRIEEDNAGRIRITPFSHRIGDSCTFTGTEVAVSMCQEISNWLHSSGLPVFAMRELAKHIIGRVTEYDFYCGLPVQSACLFDSEDTRFEQLAKDVKLPDYTSGYLCGVQHLVGDTIRGCVDVSISDASFEESVQRLIDKLRTMRGNVRRL